MRSRQKWPSRRCRTDCRNDREHLASHTRARRFRSSPFVTVNQGPAKEFAVALFDDDSYRRLVDSIRDYAIFMLDPQGRVAPWNLGPRLIKGYEPAHLLPTHSSMFYPPQP